MKLLKILHIAIFIGLFFFPASSLLAEDCHEAREWYAEGLYLSDNSMQEAAHYHRAIQLCPEFVAAHNMLGQVYKNQGKYHQSIDAFETARIQALSSRRFATRSDSKALFLESAISLGEIYRIQGKYELAAGEFSKALQVDPDSMAAQNNLQYVYKRLHNYDTVISPNNVLLVNAIFTRIPGVTLPKNAFTFDFQLKYWQQDSPPITEDMIDPSEIVFLSDVGHSTVSELVGEGFRFLVTPEKLKSATTTGIFSARYGVSNDFTVGIVPKVFYRTLDIDLDGFDKPEIPSSFELGDTELFAKYHVWGKRRQHLSFYTLLNLPTGREVRVVADNPLITRSVVEQADGTLVEQTYEFDFVRYVPFGSESYDITPGLALTVGFDPLVLQSTVQYRFTDHNLVGDEFRFNLATIYRMNRSVNGTMELNYRWQGEARRKFHTILNKFQPDILVDGGPIAVESFYTAAGGSTLFVSPGLQFTVAQGLRLELGLQVPVIKPSSGWSENLIFHFGLTYMSF